MKSVLALPAVLLLSQVFFLTSCGTRRGIEVLQQPLASSARVGDLLDANILSTPSRTALQKAGLLRGARRDPATAMRNVAARLKQEESAALRVAAAEIALNAAQRMRHEEPDDALGYYLSAVEMTRPSLYWPEGEERNALREVYNEASGQLATVFREFKDPGTGPLLVRGPLRNYRLSWKRTGRGVVPPSMADTLRPASILRVKGFNNRITRDGYGGALVAYQAGTEERRRENPFMPHVGFASAVTAMVRIPESGNATVELLDLVEIDRVSHRGKSYPLEADFTAPIATLTDGAPGDRVGRLGMFRPQKYADREGLYLLAPYRPDRIPLVLVHGLMSQPGTWIEMMNALYADPVLRERYQPLVFYYPTGFPIAKNATTLRADLAAFQRKFDPRGTNRDMKQMVLIGHSMGGILSNAQIRRGGDRIWNKLVEKPIEELDVEDAEREELRALAYFDANRNIKRVIFICAPHRGSTYANNWIGRLGSKIVSFPLGVVDRTSDVLLGAGTELTRTIITRPTDSIDNLKVGAPVLETILELPMPYNTPYHTIVGDRGRGDTPDSSDGVVPYWSAHLDGAQSEHVVPTHHSSTTHPETIAEVRRILRLHVGR